jgi:hypothetical protein
VEDQTKAKIGLGLNAVAMGAGSHALLMAGREKNLTKTPIGRRLAKPYNAWAKTRLAEKIGAKSPFARKYAGPLALGAVGLHTAELIGDGIAAQVLHGAANKPKSSKKVVTKTMNSDIYEGPSRRGEGFGKSISYASTPERKQSRKGATALGGLTVAGGAYAGHQLHGINSQVGDARRNYMQGHKINLGDQTWTVSQNGGKTHHLGKTPHLLQTTEGELRLTDLHPNLDEGGNVRQHFGYAQPHVPNSQQRNPLGAMRSAASALLRSPEENGAVANHYKNTVVEHQGQRLTTRQLLERHHKLRAKGKIGLGIAGVGALGTAVASRRTNSSGN